VPDASLDAISAPSAAPVESPIADSSALALNVMNESSPLVMKGLFAARTSSGRGDMLSRNAVGGARMRVESDQPVSQSGVISPSQDDFDVIRENPFQRVADHPLSTFSIDVDSASYAVVRRHLTEGRMPPKDAVRIEELINYFRYDYAPPTDGRPFAVHLAAAPCPWNPEHQLVRVALQARAIPRESRPALNLVFLVDVSGSMSSENRLPLVKRSLQALARQLDERDRIAIVVYAGAAGLVLPTTNGARTPEILAALEQLQSGGSTAGGAGIELAYATAQSQFVEGGVNRVILCTDGDFNVGLTQRGDLEKLIEEKARSGVFLTVLGFGMGNYKDSTLELLSGKGNGNYGYVDSFAEARRLLVDQMLGTLVTVAKDVKIQVEFNPARIAGYRLIGYENRLLRKEDFNNDRVDAGDVGAGHAVTALYELVPAGRPVPGPGQVDELKYQEAATGAAASSGELLTAKLRYKLPDDDTSIRMDFPLEADALTTAPDHEFGFACAVAGFGMILRDSAHRGSFTCDDVLELAEAGLANDPEGYRRDFLNLVRNARALTGSPGPAPEAPEAGTDR
jgi:Ca-activated chloride channel family protein